jgi:rRNA-processing protein FCF1
VFDSDALIKLNRAGVLDFAFAAFECVIPQAVIEEVVMAGRERGFEDVSDIEAAVAAAQIVPNDGRPDIHPRLGPGEQAILKLLPQMPDLIVVGDDRRFINFLAAQGIQFLLTAGVPLALVQKGSLTTQQAREALERLKPLIRPIAYWEARSALDSEGEHREQE